jgi:hypothetical protein
VSQPANGEPEAFLQRKRNAVANGSKMGICLSDLNMVLKASWPTPDASEAGKTSRGGNRKSEPLIGGLVRSWPTPQADAGSRGGPQPPEKAKAGNHGQHLQDYIGRGPSGCLALTEKFVVRLLMLSCWLMGYPVTYLLNWPKRTGRRSGRSEIR